MSLLFGIFSTCDAEVPPALLDRIDAACDWPRDQVLREQGRQSALLNIQRDTVPRFSKPLLARDGITLLFTGRLDNRPQLASSLGLGLGEKVDDEQLIYAAYRKLGSNFAQHLLGDFAICLHNENNDEIVLARDPLGTMPLFRARVGPFLAISNCIEYLRLVPGIDLTWDDAWLADTLALAKRDAIQTPYRAIRAVPPAHVVTIGPGGETRRRYWSLPSYDRVLKIEAPEATREFVRLFDQAVSCRLRSNGKVGCELSAGLDSTAITESAIRLLAGTATSLHAFTHALADTQDAHRSRLVDDRDLLAPLLAQWTDIDHQWITSQTGQLVEILRRSLARHGAPPRNDLNTIGDELPDAMHDKDVRVLLSGFGGDQLVTGHGAGYLQSLLAEHDWPALHKLMVASRGPIGGTLRTLLYALGPARIGHERRSAARTLAKAADLASIGDPRFLADHGHYGREQDRPLTGTMRQREAWLIERPHITYRMQDSAVGGFARGFVYRYPMLDIRLMEFVHNLPARLKRSPYQDRCMIRRAKEGRLPDSIRLRDKEGGATVPSAQLNFTRFAGELADLIEQHHRDPRLVGRIEVKPALETLRATRTNGEFAGSVVEKQVLLLALLALWAERDRLSDGDGA